MSTDLLVLVLLLHLTLFYVISFFYSGTEGSEGKGSKRIHWRHRAEEKWEEVKEFKK